MSKDTIAFLVQRSLTDLGIDQSLDFKVSVPPRQELGDYSSNAAIIYGRQTGQNPRSLAEKIIKQISRLDQGKICSKIELAGPGFINFFLTDKFLQETITKILARDRTWGQAEKGQGKWALLEFVSANPTGPLHVGHGRWAVIGHVLARLLKAAGYQVFSEYYVNDMGQQIELLVQSVKACYNNKPVPEGGYGGEYVKELANQAVIRDKLSQGQDIRQLLLDLVITEQKKTLADIGVEFDRWFYEHELYDKQMIEQAVKRLKELGRTFEEKGALWFKSEELGDDKNRVIVREDGRPTYFAADIAYHLDKFSRGYNQIIDIWGTDHHGYVKRLKAAMAALGQPVDKLEIIIGQLVALYRGDQPVRMSKRTGEMVTLAEVVEEIGADAVRFFFASTDVNSHLDFDLELAKKKSQDNPVYYIQYAHARICSIIRKVKSQNLKLKDKVDLSELTHPAERALLFKLMTWPDVITEAARLRRPHRLTEYGRELATTFHAFYERCRVLGNPARLSLAKSSRITLRNMLELIGVSAPESM